MSSTPWARPVVVPTPDQFDATMAAQQASCQGRIFVLFTGEVEASTGKSWCPDCVEAEPVLRASMEQHAQPNDVLVVCPVRRADYKGNDSYPYRRHKGVRLRNVPTFGRWVKGRIEMALEERANDAEAVEEVLTAKL